MASDENPNDFILELHEVMEINETETPSELKKKSPNDEGTDSTNSPVIPDDMLITHSHDVPACWSETQCHNFKQVNKWLLVKNGKLGCRSCMKIENWQAIENAEKGLRPPTIAWRTCQISFGGRTLETKQSSLRKKIFEHRNSKAHIHAIKLEDDINQIHLTEQLAKFKTQIDADTQKQIIQSVYSIIKHQQPIGNFTCTTACDLPSEKIFIAVLNHMATQLRKSIISDLTNDHKITLILEESNPLNKKSTVALYIKVHANGETEFGDTMFFDFVELSSMNSEEIVLCLMKNLKKNNITTDYLKHNLLEFVLQGNCIVLGRTTKVGGTLMQLFPNIVLRYESSQNMKLITGKVHEGVKKFNFKDHQFTTSIIGEAMFVNVIGPDTHQFDADDFLQSWLQNQDCKTFSYSKTQSTKKIANDMAMAAETHDEERLVIDLKTENSQETDNDEQTEPNYRPDTIEPDNGGSVKRKKRTWRQTDKLSALDRDVIETLVQRVREASDLYAINEDKDRLFLLSLLPFMKQLNSRENLEFRMQVQQLIHNKLQSNGQSE